MARRPPRRWPRRRRAAGCPPAPAAGTGAEGLLDEGPGGSFGLTALGTCLRGDVPGSLRGAIIARGDVYYGAAVGLLDAVQHGGSAFERVHGLSFFEYLARHPEPAPRSRARWWIGRGRRPPT